MRQPIPLQGGDVIREVSGMDGRAPAGLREGRDPLADPALPEVDQPPDVGRGTGRHHDRHGRHEARRDARPPKDDVDQASAHPPVPVEEGMDRLELGMRDRCPGQRRDVVPCEEPDKVVQERLDLSGRGRNERCAHRAVEPAAEPVLDLPGASGPRVGLARHQGRVNAADVVDGDWGRIVGTRDRLFHGADIGGHGPGAALRRTGIDQCPGQVERADLTW